MLAALFRTPGGPERIELGEVPDPSPGPGQVLIGVRAAALNHFDLLVLRETDPASPTLPFWGGADIAGEVLETGAGVTGFARGDRVVVNPGLFCGRCRECAAGQESQCADFGIIGDSVPGGCAERIVVEERNLLSLPVHVPWETAAAAPLVGQTAWRALMTQGGLRPGEDVLIVGASGGVASTAIQIARLSGARVLAVTSGPDKVARTRSLGADVVFDRSAGDWWDGVAEATHGRGVDLVLDGIGAATWAGGLRSLARGGRLVTYGRTTGRLAETDIKLVFWHQLRIIGSTMGSRGDFEAVMRLVFAGRLQPVVDATFPLAEAGAAYARLAAGEQFGKVVLRVA